jgi:threonine dehydrogenase-like Zn-dependent dehydrogenase
MKAVTFQDVGVVSVSDVPEPELLEDSDVIVRVTRCAICGSDLHLYHGDIPMMPGDTCGHEFTGVIEDTGDGVNLKRGDRVVGTFHTACGACNACRRGEFHMCSSAAVFGYGPIYGSLNGTQAEFARVPKADVNLRVIPAHSDHGLRRGQKCGRNDRRNGCGDWLRSGWHHGNSKRFCPWCGSSARH